MNNETLQSITPSGDSTPMVATPAKKPLESLTLEERAIPTMAWWKHCENQCKTPEGRANPFPSMQEFYDAL